MFFIDRCVVFPGTKKAPTNSRREGQRHGKRGSERGDEGRRFILLLYQLSYLLSDVRRARLELATHSSMITETLQLASFER